MSSSVIQCKLSRLSISEDNSDYNDSPGPHLAIQHDTVCLSNYKYIGTTEINRNQQTDVVVVVVRQKLLRNPGTAPALKNPLYNLLKFYIT